MHCVSTILKTQMNRITNSNRCRIIRQLWECSNVTISQSWIAALSLSHVAMYLTCTCTDSTSIGGVFKRYHFTVLDCRTVTVTCCNVSHIPVPTVLSTSIWGVVRHYLFTVLNAALSLPHVAMYLTCTCTDSTPMEGVLKSYHFTVVNGRTVIPNMYVCVTCF